MVSHLEQSTDAGFYTGAKKTKRIDIDRGIIVEMPVSITFRASFPGGDYERVFPDSEMASGVRLMQFEAVSRGVKPSAWKLTALALHAWESLYTCVITATRPTADGETVDMLKESHTRTICGLPFTIIDGDSAVVYQVIDERPSPPAFSSSVLDKIRATNS